MLYYSFKMVADVLGIIFELWEKEWEHKLCPFYYKKEKTRKDKGSILLTSSIGNCINWQPLHTREAKTVIFLFSRLNCKGQERTMLKIYLCLVKENCLPHYYSNLENLNCSFLAFSSIFLNFTIPHHWWW